MLRTMEELLQRALEGEPAQIAVAAGQDEAALQAVADAEDRNLVKPLLIGDPDQIQSKPLADRFGDRFERCTDVIECAKRAVHAVRSGKAQLLLKGGLKTSILLKAVLNRENGLRAGQLLSDVFVFESTHQDQSRLLMITDGGVNLKPDLNAKISIIENAVQVASALGSECPKVALLSAVESINPDLESTQDAAIITKMNQRGQIKGCLIDGPLALDNAVSSQAAKIKGIKSDVAGDADILVCPDIESGNMLAKSTTYFAHYRLAHVIIGASAPILIPSRADTADSKLLSLALGKLFVKPIAT